MGTATLSRRPLRCLWGWGPGDDRLGDDERRLLQGRIAPLPAGVADAVAHAEITSAVYSSCKVNASVHSNACWTES